jgi:ribose transport system substrate-binding protein
MATPLAKARKAGITVVNIDVPLDAGAEKAAGIDLAFFGPENRGGAKLAGDAPAKDLARAAKSSCLSQSGSRQRKGTQAGFMDAIAEGKLQLFDSKTAHWETEEANTLMTP